MQKTLIVLTMLAASTAAPLAYAEDLIIQQDDATVDEDTTGSVIIRKQEPAVVIQRQEPTVIIKKQRPAVIIDQDDGTVYDAQ